MYDHYNSKLHEWNLLGTDAVFCHKSGYQLTINPNFCSGCGCRQ